MTRIERYVGEGPIVELRYDTLIGASEETLDEIVAPGIHVEMLDDGTCWADIWGVRVTWHAVKRNLLRVRAEADSATLIRANIHDEVKGT